MHLSLISPHVYCIRQFLDILSSDSVLHFFACTCQKGGGGEEGISNLNLNKFHCLEWCFFVLETSFKLSSLK